MTKGDLAAIKKYILNRFNADNDNALIMTLYLTPMIAIDIVKTTGFIKTTDFNTINFRYTDILANTELFNIKSIVCISLIHQYDKSKCALIPLVDVEHAKDYKHIECKDNEDPIEAIFSESHEKGVCLDLNFMQKDFTSYVILPGETLEEIKIKADLEDFS